MTPAARNSAAAAGQGRTRVTLSDIADESWYSSQLSHGSGSVFFPGIEIAGARFCRVITKYGNELLHVIQHGKMHRNHCGNLEKVKMLEKLNALVWTSASAASFFVYQCLLNLHAHSPSSFMQNTKENHAKTFQRFLFVFYCKTVYFRTPQTNAFLNCKCRDMVSLKHHFLERSRT